MVFRQYQKKRGTSRFQKILFNCTLFLFKSKKDMNKHLSTKQATLPGKVLRQSCGRRTEAEAAWIGALCGVFIVTCDHHAQVAHAHSEDPPTWQGPPRNSATCIDLKINLPLR